MPAVPRPLLTQIFADIIDPPRAAKSRYFHQSTTFTGVVHLQLEMDRRQNRTGNSGTVQDGSRAACYGE
jgi:hypothetical protein